MFDWNDIKAFLAVARGGSTLAAAKALGVNQTTAARRIEALEAALGLKLFERGQTGSRLTDAGRDLMVRAEKIEQAAGAFATHAQAHQRGLSGVIKITATEVVANTSVTPAIGAFRRLYPDLQINLVISDKMLDIESGEADLAIRSGIEMPISDLVARKICDYEFALYCNRDYATRRGVPASPAELADHDLVGADGAAGDLPGMRWMFAHGGGAAPATRSNSMTNLVHTVRAGLGVAPLPCLLADADPTLIRCSEPIAEAQSHSWIVTRRELKDTPRIRAFMDFLVPFMQDDVRAREARNREIQAEADAAAAAAAQPKVSSPA